MPRYFIDTDDEVLLVRDEDGHDLHSLKAARDAAHIALADMAQQKMPDGESRTFQASVRDESGTLVYVANLKLTGEWKVAPL